MRRGWPGFIVALALASGCRKHALAPPPPVEIASAPLAEEEPLAPLPALAPEKDPEPVFPYLEDEDKAACRSIGDTSHGRVVNAVQIDESESLGILPRQKLRDLAYGTGPMAKLLTRAASAVFAATKTRLFIGDVGKRGGGHIQWSVSHNAGRDADVAFSYLDASTNKPVDAPDLVPLGKDGLSKDSTLRLDCERTWITVKALVTSPDADVQYIFISEPLKKKLLLWARDHREAPDVMEKAANVLRQPGGAAPHDDHLHVRIYCNELDVASGCFDLGNIPAGKKSFAAARDERIRVAVAELQGPSTSTKVLALMRLGVLRADSAPDYAAANLADPSIEMRHAAASVLGALGTRAHVPKLAKQFEAETDGRVRLRLLEAALALGGEDAMALLTEAITKAPTPASPAPSFDDPPAMIDLLDGASLSLGAAPEVEPERIRSFAVVMAGRVRSLDTVPALVTLLDGDDAVLRAEAAESLTLITNTDPGTIAWSDDASVEAHKKGRSAYEALWKKLGKSPRDVWLGEGFRKAGFHVRAFDRTGVWELVRASANDGYIGMNARQVLARIAEEPEIPWGTSSVDACSYYLDYFHARKARFHLADPPDVLKRACPAPKKNQ